MCEWGTHETVHCPAGFNAVNPSRTAVQVDACIADLVRALNEGGVLTLDSCCGHGKGDGLIRLVDGRELVVRHAPERMNSARPPE